MRYRIHQVKVNIDRMRDGVVEREALAEAVRKKLKDPGLDIRDVEIIKESVDARKKPDIKLVYTLDFSCGKKLKLDAAQKTDYDSIAKRTGRDKGGARPVIAGFGPCGMFAALVMAEAGMRPIVIERGQSMEERVRTVERFWREGTLDTESNVQFGEGGAGTFSDGKLTTGTRDVRISKVLKEFVLAGADSAILYKSRPHIGTDKLRSVVTGIRKKIESLGGDVYFDTKLSEIMTERDGDGRYLTGIGITKRNGETGTIETDSLMLAVGHSARDTFELMFDEGIAMEQKPFSIGVRIEHPQELIDKAQYGGVEAARILGPADYKLHHRCGDGRGVYTFCMCPGGHVINASSEEGAAVTNGMSDSGRDSGYANSGLLVDVRTSDFGSDHPLAGVGFQRKYEKLAYDNGGGKLPSTDYGRFRDDETDAVRKSLPPFAGEAIVEAMPFLGKKLRGFDSDEAVMTAVESRSSSPVRILRDSGHMSDIRGIYPAGEGAGYAGGIVSAAVDGIKTAEKIMDVIFL